MLSMLVDATISMLVKARTPAFLIFQLSCERVFLLRGFRVQGLGFKV